MKLFKLLIIGLFIPVTVYAVQFFNSSGAEVGQFNKVSCSTNVTCAQSAGKLAVSVVAAALTGDLTGDGGDQLFGFLQNQVASTTVAITASQCGSTFISNSADVMTLPEASTVLGCQLTFVCGTADDFDVNPADGTDQITSVSTTNGTTAVVTLAPAAGDAIRCTDIGGSITLEAVGANAWSQVAGGNGIWTDVN
jgi:hypothetical protein